MASRYNLRSGQDLDTTSYASLPGTSGMPVTQNPTVLKARLTDQDWEGCHPSRWIFELLHNHFTAQWPLSDAQFPWHHLVWVKPQSESQSLNEIVRQRSKYYPLVACESFACSADPCTFSVTLEISEPRMTSHWINLLLDHDTIRKNVRLAKKQDPERYAAANDDWAMQAPLNLNTYLKNLLEATSKENARSISKRNKRFFVLFGPRCFEIFRQLEFEETIDPMDDGVDGGTFTPPIPPQPDTPTGATEIGTYRAYIEDVRAEVQCIIHRGGQPAELCTPGLHADLGCAQESSVDSVLVNITRYEIMGVLPNQPKEVVVNAYKRQWELVPSKRRELIDALGSIANDLNDEQLNEYAATQSSVFESQARTQTQTNNDDAGLTNQALLFFELQPSNQHKAQTIVQAFRRKVAQDPSCANTARNMLMLISQLSTDDNYTAELMMECGEGFSLPTAKEILGLSDAHGFGSDTLDSVKEKIQNAKDKDAKTTYLEAMDKIAEHTNSIDLKETVGKLRESHGIAAPNGSSAMGDSAPAANFDLPVGLENIGNTCYLNSLLQYLFTVKPVRDIVINYDNFKLGLTDENINERLLGGNKMHMNRGEAVVAEAFAQELSELFSNLETSDKVSTRPSQRLANAVLLSTYTLLHDTKTSVEATTESQPPPLPTRPPPGPPAKEPDDVEMVTIPAHDSRDPVDTASTISSQTLVEEDSDRSYEKVETSPKATEDKVVDTVMEAGQDGEVVEIIRTSDEPMKVSESIEKEKNGTLQDIKPIDVKMGDAEELQTVDQKVLTALEHQKRSSGTDQQDVEEVMGSILGRLQSAIRPSSVDESSGIQLDKIMETFFVTTINYTKKFDARTYQKEISFDRSITAFPASEGSCSLYDALDRNFDRQILDGDKYSRYTAIKTLPPILHVLIQRSQSMGSKNGNPVEIPATLYLDRYMDAPHESEAFRDRERNWANVSRISDIKASKATVESTIPTGPFLESFWQEEQANGSITAATEDSEMVDDVEIVEEKWEFDGDIDDDYLLVGRPSSNPTAVTDLPHKPEDITNTETAIREMMKSELREKEEAVKNYHSKLRNIPYKLHAVICHRGQLMSGHYWVWIYDFEQLVWRKYNDSNVEVKRSTDEVLATLNTSGEPYFLCYVREEDKEKYVDVPRRRRPASPSDAPFQNVDTDGDIKSGQLARTSVDTVAEAMSSGLQSPQSQGKRKSSSAETESSSSSEVDAYEVPPSPPKRPKFLKDSNQLSKGLQRTPRTLGISRNSAAPPKSRRIILKVSTHPAADKCEIEDTIYTQSSAEKHRILAETMKEVENEVRGIAEAANEHNDSEKPQTMPPADDNGSPERREMVYHITKA
ncbi:ubiquitin carboxyl-terminal hydrolase 2 [Fusarium beomiforme]|uniref:ubiquitinyl hydrolase 1 n=1 Tax=Fusarium beomiforme TaxID=44412 RepID=A0A9P5AUK5_9HYPO|nr:ubiquitin carboxyl-terminal hydrolase 2 [Fusarium beomiforme]